MQIAPSLTLSHGLQDTIDLSWAVPQSLGQCPVWTIIYDRVFRGRQMLNSLSSLNRLIASKKYLCLSA